MSLRTCEPTACRIHQTLDFSRCSSSAHASALGVCPSLAAIGAPAPLPGPPRTTSGCHSSRGLRVFGGRRMRSCTQTPCTTTLHSCLSPLSPYTPLSHHPTAASAPSNSGGGCLRAAQLHTRTDGTQHQYEGTDGCVLVEVSEQRFAPHLAVALSHTPLPGVLRATCRTRQSWCRCEAQHPRGTWLNSPRP